jgi:hypothetical protein
MSYFLFISAEVSIIFRISDWYFVRISHFLHALPPQPPLFRHQLYVKLWGSWLYNSVTSSLLGYKTKFSPNSVKRLGDEICWRTDITKPLCIHVTLWVLEASEITLHIFNLLIIQLFNDAPSTAGITNLDVKIAKSSDIKFGKRWPWVTSKGHHKSRSVRTAPQWRAFLSRLRS